MIQSSKQIRKALLLCLAKNLDRIQHAAQNADPKPFVPRPIPNHIFVYWGQGLDTAPEIVRRCRKNLFRANPDCEIKELHDDNIHEYTTIPDIVKQRFSEGCIAYPQYAGFLRTALLLRHGGIWVDSTCLTYRSLYQSIIKLSPHNFITHKWGEIAPGRYVSNWFIASAKRQYILSAMHEAYICYWESFNFTCDYFLFHTLFGILLHLDATFNELYAGMPLLNADHAHALQRVLADDFNAAQFSDIQQAAFIHKLTYKFTEDQVFKKGCYAERLGLLTVP